MEQRRFWSLIDAARAAGSLEPVLGALPPDEIVAFSRWFHGYYSALRRRDLWAAVYMIDGGCSDDSFDYFRSWLVGQGEAAVLAAIADPESMERTDRDELSMSSADTAYRRVTGNDLPSDLPFEIPGSDEWPADRIAGYDWTDELLRATYPTLFARHVEPRRASMPAYLHATIEHDRYWELVEAARARASKPGVWWVYERLEEDLSTGSAEQLVGFATWHHAYNQSLFRNDLRTACRILLGAEDLDAFTGFRGWLLLQGRSVVDVAMRDPDSLLAVAKDPAEPCRHMIFIQNAAARRLRVSVPSPSNQREPLPGADTWAVDGEPGPWSAAQLRARFPTLCAPRTDAQLEGPFDFDRMPWHERKRRADELVEDAKRSDDNGAVVKLSLALRLEPPHFEARIYRARAYTKLGDLDAALADYEAACATSTGMAPRFGRAQIWWARGEHDRARAEIEAIKPYHEPAARWLRANPPPPPQVPKRVRHPKFGDGVVVSIDGQGAEQKLVIDFKDGRKKLVRKFVEVIE